MVVANDVNFSIRDFNTLNVAVPPWSIGEKECSELTNFIFSASGDLIKRPGIAKSAFTSANLVTYPVLSTGQSIYYQTGSAIYKTTSYTSAGTLDTNLANVVAAATAGGSIFFCTSTGVYRSEGPGSTTPTLISSQNVSHLVYYRFRLWGVLKGSNSIIFTDAGDYTTFPVDNVINVDSGFEACTYIHPFSDRLIIFKQRSIRNLYLTDDPASWSIRSMNQDVGALNAYSVDSKEGGIYFLGQDGVYRSDGFTTAKISAPVDPYFLGLKIPSIATINTSLIIFRDYIFVSNLTVAGTRVELMYSLRYKTWSLMQNGGAVDANINRTRRLVCTDLNGVDRLVFGSANAYWYELSDTLYTDDGQVYTCRYTSKMFDFDDPSRIKRLKWVMFELEMPKNDTAWPPPVGFVPYAKASYFVDRSVTTEQVTLNYDISKSYQAFRVPALVQRVRRVAVKLEQQSAGPFTLYLMHILYYLKRQLSSDPL